LQWLCHDDSTINIIMSTVITITVDTYSVLVVLYCAVGVDVTVDPDAHGEMSCTRTVVGRS